MYWDINKSLSYNSLWNWVIGARGCGKTYGCKKYAIQRFLKYGEQFVYVRRYKEELKKIKQFFADIGDEFPEYEFRVTATDFQMREAQEDENSKEPWLTIGYFLALSNAITQKSVSYPKVNFIIFDEFILDTGYYHYLPNEVTAFLELYSTIARLRDVKVYFISNALTITNPYFLYFGLNLPYKSNFWKDGEKLLEIVEDKEFEEAAKQTKFAKLIKDTEYAAYNIENQFLRDNSTFIAAKTVKSKYNFTMYYQGTAYGIWTDYDSGISYVSYDVDPSALLKFTLSLEDHEPNRRYVKGQFPHVIRVLLKNYQLGLVRFEKINIKNKIMEIFKYMVR